jgi:hypothetical protein
LHISSSPLFFLLVLFRSRNRVLETIEIALPTPRIVQKRRLSELLVLFQARRADRFADRAGLLFLVAGEAAATAAFVLGSGVVWLVEVRRWWLRRR